MYVNLYFWYLLWPPAKITWLNICGTCFSAGTFTMRNFSPFHCMTQLQLWDCWWISSHEPFPSPPSTTFHWIKSRTLTWTFKSMNVILQSVLLDLVFLWSMSYCMHVLLHHRPQWLSQSRTMSEGYWGPALEPGLWKEPVGPGQAQPKEGHGSIFPWAHYSEES